MALLLPLVHVLHRLDVALEFRQIQLFGFPGHLIQFEVEIFWIFEFLAISFLAFGILVGILNFFLLLTLEEVQGTLILSFIGALAA